MVTRDCAASDTGTIRSVEPDVKALIIVDDTG
jgi:hypothetical protein